jgi:hypothetical protein
MMIIEEEEVLRDRGDYSISDCEMMMGQEGNEIVK